MQLELVLSVALGLWIAVMLVAVSLCRAAKRSDDAMDAALAIAIAAGHDAELTRPPSCERSLRTLSLDHAATLLEVSPETLLAWEARYGFPTSSPSSDARYNQSDVLALRASLEDEVSVASAVIRARERTVRRRPATAAELVEHRDGGLAS